jgi:hypothetical protein
MISAGSGAPYAYIIQFLLCIGISYEILYYMDKRIEKAKIISEKAKAELIKMKGSDNGETEIRLENNNRE